MLSVSLFAEAGVGDGIVGLIYSDMTGGEVMYLTLHKNKDMRWPATRKPKRMNARLRLKTWNWLVL